MLVLSRKSCEVVIIGGTADFEQMLKVTVLEISNGKVRLGFEASKDVAIHRGEVWERIRNGARSQALPVSAPIKGESSMRKAQQGDRVQVHYVKRSQDGSVVSSRGHAPVELTVGVDHPRLPGLGLALVGMAPGASTTVTVPPEQAYGRSDPGLVYRLARTRFTENQVLVVGQWVRLTDRRHRRRLVRIVGVGDRVVVVDNNHPKAGQALSLEVELLTIHGEESGPALREP